MTNLTARRTSWRESLTLGLCATMCLALSGCLMTPAFDPESPENTAARLDAEQQLAAELDAILQATSVTVAAEEETSVHAACKEAPLDRIGAAPRYGHRCVVRVTRFAGSPQLPSAILEPLHAALLVRGWEPSGDALPDLVDHYGADEPGELCLPNHRYSREDLVLMVEVGTAMRMDGDCLRPSWLREVNITLPDWVSEDLDDYPGWDELGWPTTVVALRLDSEYLRTKPW